jgi:hypothetical protein
LEDDEDDDAEAEAAAEEIGEEDDSGELISVVSETGNWSIDSSDSITTGMAKDRELLT